MGGKTNGTKEAHTCIPQYREYPPGVFTGTLSVKVGHKTYK